MIIPGSPIVLVIRVIVITEVITIIRVAARTLVWSHSPVIVVVGGVVIRVVPVIWWVTLIVSWVVSPILIAVNIPVWVILVVILGVVI